MKRNRSRRKNAFTLVEILIVVVILGILAAIVVPQFTNAADEARDANEDSTIRTIRSQLELFRNNNGAYPTFDNTLWVSLQGAGLLQDVPRHPAPGAANTNDHDNDAGTPGAATVGADGSGEDFEIYLDGNGALVVESGV